MILQNKRTGQRVVMTRKQYETLRLVGYAGGWLVISKEDEPSELAAKKIIPKDIIDFSKITKKQTKKRTKTKTDGNN